MKTKESWDYVTDRPSKEQIFLGKKKWPRKGGKRTEDKGNPGIRVKEKKAEGGKVYGSGIPC